MKYKLVSYILVNTSSVIMSVLYIPAGTKVNRKFEALYYFFDI